MKSICITPRRILVSSVLAITALLAVAGSAMAQTPTFEELVLERVNEERWNNGQLPPLKGNANLAAASETHSTNMATRNFFAHCDPDNGSLPWDRMTAAGYGGYNWAAENVAAGYSNPTAAMNGWMNSQGHRSNILSLNVREIGVGHYHQSGDVNNIRFDANGDCSSDSFNHGPYYHYWTQNFGKINSVYPVVINREQFSTEDPVVDLYVYGGFAQQVRFRNEEGAWSSWQTYSANITWSLSAGNGEKTVTAELKNGSVVRTSVDRIHLTGQEAIGVPEETGVTPVIALFPAYPNPFAGSTRFGYELAEEAQIFLAVHDVMGRRVAVLREGVNGAGYHEVSWGGRDESGRAVVPGVYFLTLRTGNRVERAKVVLRR